MQITSFDCDQFASPESEQTLTIFETPATLSPSLIDFAYKALYWEYQNDKATYGTSWASKYTWEDRKKLFTPIPIGKAQFTKKLDQCVGDLKNPPQINLDGKFQKAFLMQDEWDAICLIAHLGNSFYGVLWETSA